MPYWITIKDSNKNHVHGCSIRLPQVTIDPMARGAFRSTVCYRDVRHQDALCLADDICELANPVGSIPTARIGVHEVAPR